MSYRNIGKEISPKSVKRGGKCFFSGIPSEVSAIKRDITFAVNIAIAINYLQLIDVRSIVYDQLTRIQIFR